MGRTKGGLCHLFSSHERRSILTHGLIGRVPKDHQPGIRRVLAYATAPSNPRPTIKYDLRAEEAACLAVEGLDSALVLPFKRENPLDNLGGLLIRHLTKCAIHRIVALFVWSSRR